MPNSNDQRFRSVQIYIREAFSRESIHLVFCVYFIVVVLLAGGCGLWESFVMTDVPCPLMACNTIALSVAASACVDLIIARNNQPFKALGLLIGVLIIIFHFLSMHYVKTLIVSWSCAIGAWLLAHLTWWTVNIHNPNLSDYDPRDSSGGSTDAALLGEGKFKGLKVD